MEQREKTQWKRCPPTSTKLQIIAQLPQQNKLEEFRTKKRATSVIPLQYFLDRTNTTKSNKQTTPETYAGNILDSSHPTRCVGKHREIPKIKIPSKLKRDILKQESKQVVYETSINYCDNLVTEDLNNATTVFLKKIVGFQEQAFKRDADKARIKKRYVVGIHETRKYIITKKVKLLVIANDLKVNHVEELLYKNIFQLKELCKTNEIPYIFALKRSKIGNLTMKHRPVSCIAILNYQSAEDELQNIFQNLVKINNDDKEEEDADVYEELLDKLKEVILHTK